MSLAFDLYEREQRPTRHELVAIHITIGCYRSPLMFFYILVTNVICVYTDRFDMCIYKKVYLCLPSRLPGFTITFTRVFVCPHVVNTTYYVCPHIFEICVYEQV